jgi:hypothetical protein
MSLLSRYMRHRAPGSTQDDALVNRYLPLDAGRMTLLANNAQHLCAQNPRRALRHHPGVRDFYAPAGDSALVAAPSPSQIRWATSQKDGACTIDLGTFYVWAMPGDPGRLPRVTCEFTVMVEGGFTLGWVFAVSPGTRGPLAAVAYPADVTTSATWTLTEASVDLEAGHVAPWAMAPTNGVDEVVTAEAGQLMVFRAFLGAYNSSNTNAGGSLASIVGVSLYTEPRP